jgi:hypothetical protein
MRATVCVSLFVSVAATIGCGARAQEAIGLDRYTCAEFLADANSPADGAKLLKSLMIIYWATGYAAAHDETTLRADTDALRLIAATLGATCRSDPRQLAVRAFARTLGEFTAPNVRSETVGPALAPVAVSKGEFKTYDNWDISGADLRTVKRVDHAKCVAACRSDERCRAYSYDKWNRWCFLKSGIGSLLLDPSSSTGVRGATGEPAVSELAPRLDRRSAKKFSGQEYRTAAGPSAESCETMCQQDTKCLGYTFVGSAQKCQLFERIDTFSNDRNAASGVKTQTPP